MIPGGYYLKARTIQDSWIAHAPPHVREIWDWLIRNANYQDIQTNGLTIRRGQLFTSYKDIQDGLSWKVGWRVERYSKNDCETTMNMLKKHTMIHTKKTTRGMIITIINYNTYQDPSKYEVSKETYRRHTHVIQTADTISKEVKKEKKENKILSASPESENGNPTFYETKKKRKLTGERLRTFQEFWKVWKHPKGKAEAADVWYDMKLTRAMFQRIMDAAEQYANIERPELLKKGLTPKWAQGWLSAKRWEDEVVEGTPKSKWFDQ